jgi:UDP:flavonoid glycosyltransferase YjiC (YdhE family)
LRAIVLDAIRRLKTRAVIVTGSGGALFGFGQRDDVCEVKFVDYDWLFPRVSTVVHQGGVGTASFCLTAGLPQVVVPYCLDHRFWGWRLQELGVAPRALPRHKLTASALALTVRQVVEEPGYLKTAAALAPSIRAEDGLNRALSILSVFINADKEAEPRPTVSA